LPLEGLRDLDLYLIHTPFAFQPGDDQDPRDQNGNILYDRGVTLLETRGAMESLVDSGKCRPIGQFCKKKDIVVLAFAPLGHGMRPRPLEDSVISVIAARVGKTPAQVLLAWAVQRGTALLTTPRTPARARENGSMK
jgi:alcohol dehydrogenase (NADP+)